MKPMDRKIKRKVIKIVSKNLNSIYSASKEIAKMWDKQTIPLTTLGEIINRAKPSVNTGNKDIDLFNINYCATLDLLKKELASIAKKMDSKSIPIETLKTGLNTIKVNFTKGFN